MIHPDGSWLEKQGLGLKKKAFLWLGSDRSWVQGWFRGCCLHMSGSDAMCSKNTSGILPICQPGRAGHRLEVGIPSGESR